MKNLNNCSDEELASLCMKEDREALETLLLRHHNMLKGLILSITKDVLTTEDILQEFCIKVQVAFKEKKYKERGTLKAWFKKIIINITIDFLRKKNMYVFSLKEEDSDEDFFGYMFPTMSNGNTPLEQEIKRDRNERLREVVGTLNEREEYVITRHYLEERSFVEINIEEGREKTHSTIRTGVRNACKKLKKKLKSKDLWI